MTRQAAECTSRPKAQEPPARCRRHPHAQQSPRTCCCRCGAAVGAPAAVAPGSAMLKRFWPGRRGSVHASYAQAPPSSSSSSSPISATATPSPSLSAPSCAAASRSMPPLPQPQAVARAALRSTTPAPCLPGAGRAVTEPGSCSSSSSSTEVSGAGSGLLRGAVCRPAACLATRHTARARPKPLLAPALLPDQVCPPGCRRAGTA